MKFKTKSGKEATFGPGCTIKFFLDQRTIAVQAEEGRILWPRPSYDVNADDKIMMPGCIHNEEDCGRIVDLIAEFLGLSYEPVKQWSIGGPAFKLVAKTTTVTTI